LRSFAPPSGLPGISRLGGRSAVIGAPLSPPPPTTSLQNGIAEIRLSGIFWPGARALTTLNLSTDCVTRGRPSGASPTV